MLLQYWEWGLSLSCPILTTIHLSLVGVNFMNIANENIPTNPLVKQSLIKINLEKLVTGLNCVEQVSKYIMKLKLINWILLLGVKNITDNNLDLVKGHHFTHLWDMQSLVFFPLLQLFNQERSLDASLISFSIIIYSREHYTATTTNIIICLLSVSPALLSGLIFKHQMHSSKDHQNWRRHIKLLLIMHQHWTWFMTDPPVSLNSQIYL